MIEKDLKKLKELQMRLLQIVEESQKMFTKKSDQEIYTLAQVAQKFSVTVRTIYNWKEQGILPCTVIGSKTYITQNQLDEFLSFHEVKLVIRGRRIL